MSERPSELEIRRKVISGLKWSTILKIASQLVSWVTTLVVVRYLTPYDYGLNAMLEVPIEIGMLFGGWGMYSALIQQKQTPQHELGAVFGFLLLLNGLIFMVLVTCAGLIASYFREPHLVELIWAISIIFLLLPFRTIPNALLDQQLDFKLRSQVDLAASLCGSVIALVLALLGTGVWALVAAVIANYVVRAVVLLFIQPWLVRPHLDFAVAKPLLVSGSLILMTNVIFVATGKSLDLIAAPTLGAHAIGLFAVAQQLALMPISRLMPIINQTLYPAFALLRDNVEASRTYLLKSIEMSSIVIFPLTLGMACVANDMILVLFGEKWLPMELPLILLGLSMPIMLVRQLCCAPLNALGQAKPALQINLAIFLMQALGAFIAMQYGIMGLVALVMLVQPVALILSYCLTRNIYRIHSTDLLKATRPACIAATLMALPLIALNMLLPISGHIALLLVKIALGGICYVLAIRFLFPPQYRDIRGHLTRKKTAA